MSRTIIMIWLFSFVSMSNILASEKSSSDSLIKNNCDESFCRSLEITKHLFPDINIDFVNGSDIEEIIKEYISGNSEKALTLLKTLDHVPSTNSQLIAQLKSIKCAILINTGNYRQAANEINALSVYSDKHNIPCGKTNALIQLARLFFLTDKEDIAQSILSLAFEYAIITKCQQAKLDISLLKAQFYSVSGKIKKSNQAILQARNILTFSNHAEGLLRYLVLYSPLAMKKDTLIISAFENELFLLQQKCNSVYLKTLIGLKLIQKAIANGRYINANTLINQLINKPEYSSLKYALQKAQINLILVECLIHQNNIAAAKSTLTQTENLLNTYPKNIFNLKTLELKTALSTRLNDIETLILLKNEENNILNALSDTLSQQAFTATTNFFQATLKKAVKKDEERENRINTVIILTIILLIGFVIIGFLFSQYRTEQNFNSRHIELKQELLISQLGPKFSYRWLSGLKDMVKEREPDEAADYLSIFAKFTRTILHAPQNDFISLKQELESIERYYWLLQQNTLIPIKLTISLPEDESELEVTVPPFFSHIITEIILGSFLSQNKETIAHLDISEKTKYLYLNYTIKTKDESCITLDSATKQELMKAERMINERHSLLKKLHKRDIRIIMNEELDSKGQYNMLFRIAKLEKRARRFRILL